MSEKETHIGMLEKIPIENGMTVEEKAEEICKNRFGITELETYYDDWIERLQDLNDEEFVICSDCIYHVISHKEISDVEIFNAERNLDGTISYVVTYYNGGCGFVEAIETALERLGGEQ